MNAEIQRFWDLNRMYSARRDELMDLLSDADLDYSPGGANPSLGQLCAELGATQAAYVESFRTFMIDFTSVSDDSLPATVSALRAWYARLDEELEAALRAISDDDVATRQVDRGDFQVPASINLDLLREALLIFYGKASVYAKAMGKGLPPTWQMWFG